MGSIKKSTLALIIATIVLALIVGVTIPLSVDNANKTITDIGTVEYTTASKAKLDKAVKAYNSLDDNFKLKNQVTEKAKLEKAKKEYIRLAIKAASVADARKTVDNISTADITKYVTDARQLVKDWLDSDEYTDVENYSDLVDLEKTYSSSSSGSSEDVEIPMC